MTNREVLVMSLKPRKVLGTPYANGAKLLFLGAGELGKETMIEAQRMGIEIVASTGTPIRRACRWRIRATSST